MWGLGYSYNDPAARDIITRQATSPNTLTELRGPGVPADAFFVDGVEDERVVLLLIAVWYETVSTVVAAVGEE